MQQLLFSVAQLGFFCRGQNFRVVRQIIVTKISKNIAAAKFLFSTIFNTGFFLHFCLTIPALLFRRQLIYCYIISDFVFYLPDSTTLISLHS